MKNPKDYLSAEQAARVDALETISMSRDLTVPEMRELSALVVEAATLANVTPPPFVQKFVQLVASMEGA